MTACLLKNEPTSLCTRLVKPFWGGAEAKASVNSATGSLVFPKSFAQDPKSGELAMSRVKFVETQMEARTGWPCNTIG